MPPPKTIVVWVPVPRRWNECDLLMPIDNSHEDRSVDIRVSQFAQHRFFVGYISIGKNFIAWKRFNAVLRELFSKLKFEAAADRPIARNQECRNSLVSQVFCRCGWSVPRAFDRVLLHALTNKINREKKALDI
jgi:hypothetical protein